MSGFLLAWLEGWEDGVRYQNTRLDRDFYELDSWEHGYYLGHVAGLRWFYWATNGELYLPGDRRTESYHVDDFASGS